jgi:Tfp pilus assembly protein FimT
MRKQSNSSGFTIVEVIVTLAVTTLFLTLFFQVYLAMESQRIGVARQALASNIAYANLRKFTTRPAIPSCTSAMDMTTSNPTGLLLGDENSSSYGFVPEPASSTNGLGANIHQTVKAYAPRGCTTFSTDPIKIESTVSYGNNGDQVVHASYVN